MMHMHVYLFSGSKMCVLHHSHGNILDNRGASYSGDVITSDYSFPNGWLT